MANYIQKERALAAAKDAPFCPYLAPQISEAPRMPADADRVAARSRWLTFSEQAKCSLRPQQLGVQAFSLYQLRFVLAADLCKAWRLFGGLGPQLSHFPNVLHLSITESAGAAISYLRLVSQKLHEEARKRSSRTAEFVATLTAGEFALKGQSKKEVALAIESDQRTRGRPVKAKGKGVRAPFFDASDHAQADRQRSRSTRNAQQLNRNADTGAEARAQLSRNDNNNNHFGSHQQNDSYENRTHSACAATAKRPIWPCPQFPEG